MHQALTTEDPIRPNSATVHADAVSAVAVSCAALREAGGPTLVAVSYTHLTLPTKRIV